jgi:hypothetical protein
MKTSLAEWAKLHFRKPPSLWTLRRMARDGEITPQPVLVGREYQVEETARLTVDVQARPSLVDRVGGR